MLTRLKINGFKNLVDLDISFGPFTCVAGSNGVGKSNLFDAIIFLSALADKPLLDAALSVRSERGLAGDPRSIFHRRGRHYSQTMSLEAEMIVPERGTDDLGQEAEASITFLRYSLVLAYSGQDGHRSSGTIQIEKEELEHISLGDAPKHLLFKHQPKWRKSVLLGRRTSPFISTERKGQDVYVKLHQDGGKTGRTRLLLARNLPRTVLSSANAAESPTVLLARREMQSWRLLQLEPSALRSPDSFSAPTRVATNGAHIPATLARLGKVHKRTAGENDEAAAINARVASRLAELVEGIRAVRIDADERRELLTLVVTDRDGTEHEARSLSDGTLRFLALCVLENDPEAQGLLCLEEPENGIHPERIPAMLDLLQDLAVDTYESIGIDNPLRQVIINTHSPAVVGLVPDDSLVVASAEPRIDKGRRFSASSFRWLNWTWRTKVRPDHHPVSRGVLLSYLNPVSPAVAEKANEKEARPLAAPPRLQNVTRVIDRKDLQLLLPLFSSTES